MPLVPVQKHQVSIVMMKIHLGEDEIAYLCGQKGTLAMTKALGYFFYLETDTEEIIIFTEKDDLLVASAFGTGEKIRRGLGCTLYQIRELRSPLIVLPKGHPASPRLNTVVSVGSKTRIRCDIQAGTHPEQDVLCGTEEFEDVVVQACPCGAEVENFEGEMKIVKM